MYTISIEVLYSISSVAGAAPHQCFSDQKLDWFKLDKNWGRIESCQSGFLNVQFYTKYVVLIYLCSQNYKYEVTKLMHESIPGVTIPPPGTPPKICLIDSSRGFGICLSSFHVRARGLGIVIVAKDPGDLTNGCSESHPQILRQQNLVSGTQGQGGVKFIVRISENYNLCRANLSTTIEGL